MGAGSTLAMTLVGREREMSELREVAADGGQLVVLRGVAGVGKSRLVRELTAELTGRGGRVLMGRCTEAGTQVALRPITELLLGAARFGVTPPESMAGLLPSLARIVREWGPAADADPSVLVLGEATLRLAASLATAGATTMLVIEDVQWADADTLTLVEYIADAVSGLPVIVVATCRAELPTAGLELVDRLSAARRVTAIDVLPLDHEGVTELARACLGVAELPDGLGDTLEDRSDGIPFLVEELLAAAPSPDELERALPASVLASVQSRLAGLPEDAVRIVRCAALLGRQFPSAVAVAAAGVGDASANEGLRAATRAQLLERHGGGFRFRHALTRDAVLADVLEFELPELSRTVLVELERLDPNLSGENAMIAAELAAQAGNPGRAASLNALAARRALASGSLSAAECMARRAVELAGIDPPDTALLLLTILNQSGRHDEAWALGERLRDATDGDTLAAVCVALAAAAVNSGRWDDADSAIATSLSAAGDDAEHAARLDVLSAQVALGRADLNAAVELARRAADDDDPVTRCEALEVIGRVERLRQPDVAAGAFELALDTARRHGLRTWQVRALQELGTIDMYTTLDTERMLAAREQAERLGAVSTVAVVDLQLSALFGERLELDQAVAAAVSCQTASQRFGLPTLAMAYAIEATAHGKAGRADELEQAAAQARRTGVDQVNVEMILWGNAIASLHLHRDDRAAAFEALGRSIDHLLASPSAGAPFAGMWALLATTLDQPNAAEARAQLAALEFATPMSRAALVAADAVAAGDRGEVDEAERAIAEASQTLTRYHGHYRLHLVRWLVAPRAHAAGWGQAESWLRQAVVGFDQLGLADLSRSARDELRALGVAVPRTRTARPVPVELAALAITGRERDVLMLVAEGLGNREIAQRLYLSPRTIEKHVERLKTKTGLDRTGLAGLARGMS